MGSSFTGSIFPLSSSIFSSVKDSVESNKAGYIRLTDAAGLWKLDKISSNTTLVTYTWNGQLLGNFPEFGLEKAWITQGNEVLEWLTLELSKKINPLLR